MQQSYDCVVMGGGPAGSTVGALVADAGFSALIVERERFPRFHVGESLMPETYWIFKRLGVLERMKASSFVEKVSVQFINHAGRESQPFFFSEHDPHESSQTWQVERSEFDQMLFENAQQKGAHCLDQTRVVEVSFDGDRACGVELQAADGTRRTVASQVVVDATGQQSLIANALQLKRVNPDLRKAAIWGYFRGARRDPGEHGGATIVFQTQSQNAWFWYIPLSDGVTSVGVVGDHEYLLKDRGQPEEAFRYELADCPAMTERLADAERDDKLRVAKEFSYATERAAGDGWVLVGDAWGFIDPIYSSGVYFAMKSGELAADCLVEGLRNGDTSAARLGRWCEPFAAGTGWIRKLVAAYYSKDFSIGRFIKEHPQHLGNLTDLLIGRIFQPQAGAIFQDLDPWFAKIKD